MSRSAGCFTSQETKNKCYGKKKIDQAIDHSFYGFTGVITHTGCWENMRKACKSLAFGS